jgi:hypothetical protein
MHPILSNRDVLMAVILACGLIVASVLAMHSMLRTSYTGVAAMEPSTLGGGSAAADIPSVAYLDGSHELAALIAVNQGDISSISIRTAIP